MLRGKPAYLAGESSTVSRSHGQGNSSWVTALHGNVLRRACQSSLVLGSGGLDWGTIRWAILALACVVTYTYLSKERPHERAVLREGSTALAPRVVAYYAMTAPHAVLRCTMLCYVAPHSAAPACAYKERRRTHPSV